MKFIAFALTALSSTAALANPLPDPDPLLGKRILPPKWHLQVTPGGQPVVIEGTVQQVRSELLRLNPRYLEDFPPGPPGPEPTRLWTHPMVPVVPPGPDAAARRSTGGDVDVRDVEGRDTNFGGGYYFCGGYRMANWGHIREGLDYLDGIQGALTLDAGTDVCSRVSCSYQSAIYACNNATKALYLDSFSHIADGARDIGNSCAWMDTDGVQKVAGQIFHPDGWNVLVRGDTSHC